MNTARGYLAEYLVAKAIGDDTLLRVEWGPYDAMAADGTRVEVKTSGRLQSWMTKKPSSPSWSFKSVRASRVWSNEIGDWVQIEPKERVHVWVFALQTCEEAERYDVLALDQWEFRVVPHRQLLATGQTSAGLSFFARHGIEPVPYRELRDAVRSARAANDALGHC